MSLCIFLVFIVKFDLSMFTGGSVGEIGVPVSWKETKEEQDV